MTEAQTSSLELGLVGNCQVAVLIDRVGRFVWGSFPRMDSDPAFCSLLNSCDFCFGAHKNVCMALGVDEGLFLKLVDDIDTAPVSDKLKPILKYVRKLTLTPDRMTDDDAKACYRVGWNEEDLTIAITVCASWNWFNRMIEGHGIDKKWDEKVFRDRGAPERMATGYKNYYDEMVANGMADTSGPKNPAPPQV